MADVKIPYADPGRASFEQMDTYLQQFLLAGNHPQLSPAYGYPVQFNANYEQFSVLGLDSAGELVRATDGVAVAATRTVGSGNGALTFTARTPGARGNLITVAIVATASTASVAVSGNAITITPATAAATANDVAALVNNHPDANDLVSVAAGGTGGSAVGTAASGALAGGLDDVKAIGVLAHAVSRGPSPAAAAVNGQVLYQGNFNQDALVWHASFDSDAKKQAAFRGSPTPTNIIVGKRA